MPIKNTSAKDLAAKLGGRRAGSAWRVPGPNHSPDDDSLVLKDTPDGVVFHSHAGDDSAAVIEYLTAAAQGASLAGGSRPEANTRTDVERIERATRIWDEAEEIAPRCAAARYLASRGLIGPYRSELRFHPGIYWESKNRPALVGRISHAYSGVTTGVHITFLTPSGEKDQTVSLDNSKAMIGKVGGCGLWPVSYDGAVIVAEGIESALSAELQFGIPAVAALNAANILKLYLPSAIRLVVIVADNDASGKGLEYAERAALHFLSTGRAVQIVLSPNVGQDANDVLKQAGAEFRPVPVDLARKSPPLSEAETWGGGAMIVATKAINHPYLNGAIELADGSTVSRLRLYLKLCERAQGADEAHEIHFGQEPRDVYQVVVPRGCVFATRRYIANMIGIGVGQAENFIKQLSKLGLISIRQALMPDGRPIPRRDVPDMLELPSLGFRAVFSEGFLRVDFNTENPSTLAPPSSRQGVPPFSRQGVSIEERAIAMGYEVRTPAPIARGEGGPIAKYLERDIQKEIISNSSLEEKRTHARDGASFSLFVPSASGAQPWFGVPPELRRRSERAGASEALAASAGPKIRYKAKGGRPVKGARDE